MNNTQIKESEIPYGILAKFGLTQEMIEDLPERVQKDMLGGRMTPVLPIFIVDDNGEEVAARTRFSLIRDEQGSVDILFYPQLKTCNLDRFSEEDRKALLENRAIITTATMNDCKKVQAFHQIDPGTNQILWVPTPVIGRNLEVIANQMKLTNAELVCLQKGMPMSVALDNDMLTVGIDLTETSGIRFALGDERKWREEQKQPYSKYNFGLNGCWMMDSEGNFDYVHEDNYTQELVDERAKVINRRSQMAIK